MTLKESALQFLSNFDHFGQCQRCQISWKYRDSIEPIRYQGGSSTFPLCQQCFDEIDADTATGYFMNLWVGKWGRDTDDDAREAWETFRENARHRKRGKPEHAGDVPVDELVNEGFACPRCGREDTDLLPLYHTRGDSSTTISTGSPPYFWCSGCEGVIPTGEFEVGQ